MLLNRIQIAALVDALGLHLALAERALAAGFGEPAQTGAGIGGHHAQQGAEIAVVELVAGALQVVEVGKHLFGARDVARRAFNLDRIGLQVDGYAESILHQVQVFIAGAKQGFDLGADVNIFLHRDSITTSSACAQLCGRSPPDHGF